MTKSICTLLLAMILFPGAIAADSRLPIIDMHIHASFAGENGPPPMGFCAPYLEHLPPFDGRKPVDSHWLDFFKNPPCENPIWSPETDDQLIAESFEAFERLNIIAVAGGQPEMVDVWHKTNPARVIKAASFTAGDGIWDVDAYRELFESGDFRVMSEIAPQYQGMSPLDEKLEPFWKLAEELQIPIGFHMVDGIPAINATFAPEHRALVGNPELLEEVLIRHPRLRLFVMHYGSPWVDEMIAILNVFPQVYVELGGIQWVYPERYFYSQLKELVDAGFGKRIMYGSDQMTWPGLIDHSVAVVEQADFLSEEQKRDIFYNNAARFLQLSEAEIARHHALVPD